MRDNRCECGNVLTIEDPGNHCRQCVLAERARAERATRGKELQSPKGYTFKAYKDGREVRFVEVPIGEIMSVRETAYKIALAAPAREPGHVS